jgi:hypothetical protein
MEAFPWNEAPSYLVRDRDQVYGTVVIRRLRAMGIWDPVAPGSPWQNGFAERLIGSIRRECVDHFVVWGEAHLRRILQSYARYQARLGSKCGNLARTAPRCSRRSTFSDAVDHHLIAFGVPNRHRETVSRTATRIDEAGFDRDRRAFLSRVRSKELAPRAK